MVLRLFVNLLDCQQLVFQPSPTSSQKTESCIRYITHLFNHRLKYELTFTEMRIKTNFPLLQKLFSSRTSNKREERTGTLWRPSKGTCLNWNIMLKLILQIHIRTSYAEYIQFPQNLFVLVQKCFIQYFTIIWHSGKIHRVESGSENWVLRNIGFHLTSIRMATIRKPQKITCGGNDMKKLEHFCTGGGNI